MAEQLLRNGSKGPAVTELQELLTALEYDPGEVDGIFGPKTESAVRKLQADAGVVVDGIVGPKTWVAINEADKTEPTIRSGAKGTSTTAAPQQARAR